MIGRDLVELAIGSVGRRPRLSLGVDEQAQAVASWPFFSRQLAWLSSVAIAGSSFWLASKAAHASANLPLAMSS